MFHSHPKVTFQHCYYVVLKVIINFSPKFSVFLLIIFPTLTRSSAIPVGGLVFTSRLFKARNLYLNLLREALALLLLFLVIVISIEKVAIAIIKTTWVSISLLLCHPRERRLFMKSGHENVFLLCERIIFCVSHGHNENKMNLKSSREFFIHFK